MKLQLNLFIGLLFVATGSGWAEECPPALDFEKGMLASNENDEL